MIRLSSILILLSICIISCDTIDSELSSQLIYTTSDGKIAKINSDGSDKIILVSVSGYNEIVAAPVNKKFIYTNYALSTEAKTVYLYDMNTNTNIKIVEENSDYSFSGICLSNSGNKILLTAFDKNSFFDRNDIAIINTDGTNLHNITTEHNTRNNIPAFTSDDTKIAFFSINFGLYTVNTNGTNLIKLDSLVSFGDETGFYLSWNANNSKIAYITKNPDTQNLVTINSDGSNKQNILLDDNPSDPIWSNDGTKIIFSRTNASRTLSNIYSVGNNGSNLISLTNNTETYKYLSNPQLNKTEDKIVYVERRYGVGPNPDIPLSSIYILNTSNNTSTKISNDDVGFTFKAFWVE